MWIFRPVSGTKSIRRRRRSSVGLVVQDCPSLGLHALLWPHIVQTQCKESSTRSEEQKSVAIRSGNLQGHSNKPNFPRSRHVMTIHGPCLDESSVMVSQVFGVLFGAQLKTIHPIVSPQFLSARLLVGAPMLPFIGLHDHCGTVACPSAMCSGANSTCSHTDVSCLPLMGPEPYLIMIHDINFQLINTQAHEKHRPGTFCGHRLPEPTGFSVFSFMRSP